MDDAAIKEIGLSSNIPAILEHVNNVKSKVPVVVTPKDFSISSMEKYMDLASFYRMKFNTISINDFIAYCNDNISDTTKCFVDPEEMLAKAIFDLGTLTEPEHKHHTATLRLRKTAAYEAVLAVNGSHLDQRKACDWIEDWAESLQVFTRSGGALTAQVAANYLSDLTIETAKSVTSTVGSFSEGMSAMEKIEAKGADLAPGELHFKFTPYLGFEEEKLVLKVQLLTGGQKPEISFRITRLESFQEELSEDFKSLLRKGFGGELELYLGSAD